jgi:hypothetical protein
MEDTQDIDFSGRVLDNVHGFIYYTKTEERIMNTLLFKRLQSIKQLSIVNWVFPGSEHTRYIHSLGVMYIADKMALQLGLTPEKRRIVRLAGLLHDIGHYPLSHVCEYPYKESLEDFPDSKYCQSINKKVKSDIDGLKEKSSYIYMKKSNGCHHEQIGADIVCNNREIKDIIVNECGESAPEIIADMITGNVERTDPLLVQILHSELDADGIDYLMRDAMFSGTSFGAFELDQLIGCMCIGKYKDKDILCISPKGIAAADQYLVNKFFSYSQVVFNKHISVTEWMAEQIVNWMQRNNAYFPRSAKLKKLVTNPNTDDAYIGFTDNFFWASLQNLLDNPLSDTEPSFIKYFCRQLLHHSELTYEDNSEVKIVSTNMEDIRKELQKSNYYKRLDGWEDRIGILSTRSISKQIRQRDFDKMLQDKIEEDSQRPNDPDIVTEEDSLMLRARRLMECICVKDDDELHLLCDDKRSMMQTMYNLKLAIFRTYKCNPE